MNIKKITNTALMFTITRLIEIFGIATLFLGLLLLTSLITYSPDDPNFIFSKDIEIISFEPPCGDDNTGVPHAMDSKITNPKPSKSIDGKINRSELDNI